jgi:hypothetical protein
MWLPFGAVDLMRPDISISRQYPVTYQAVPDDPVNDGEDG